MRYLKSLFGIANNLNQAVHLAHIYGNGSRAVDLSAKLDDILSLINHIRLS
jgi:hypothetical protein